MKGWSFEEMVFLYGFSLIPLGIFNVLSWNLYMFPDRYLIEGRFDRVLLRPVVLGLPGALRGLPPRVAPGDARPASSPSSGRRGGCTSSSARSTSLLFVVWAFLGAAIYLAIFVGLSATSFWIEDRIGIVPPIFNLMQFGRYPLSIYDAWIRFVLSFVIPFAFATFFPTIRFLRRPEFLREFWAVPLVAAATVGIALVAWNEGVKRYHSTGS